MTSSSPDATPFRPILRDLVRGVPDAIGAVFVDAQGEAIDFYAHLEEADLRLVGAHLGRVWTSLARAMEHSDAGSARELILVGDRAKMLVRAIDREYYVVMTIKPRSPTAQAARALATAADRLRLEM